jgi:hypothetical protein
MIKMDHMVITNKNYINLSVIISFRTKYISWGGTRGKKSAKVNQKHRFRVYKTEESIRKKM